MNYKLSKILDAQEKLKNIDRNNLSMDLIADLEKIADIVTDFDLINNGKVKRNIDIIKNKLDEINSIIDELHQLTNEFENNLDLERKTSHQSLLKEINNKLYTFDWPTDDDYLNHRNSWPTAPFIIEKAVSLIGKYIDWRFPVLYLEPHTAELTRYLVSGDPFYVVDNRTEPYNKMLSNMPVESVNKLYHYKKSDATHLEPNSVGMCVSWRNFQFKKLGEVRSDIELMAKLTVPGGYVLFEYVDASEAHTAKAIEHGDFAFQWRDRIMQFLQENNLEVLHEIKFSDHSPILMFCKKQGNLPDINLINKLGLVLLDREILEQKRKYETEMRKFYKGITSNLQKEMDALVERDKLLNDLEQQRKVDTAKINHNKIKTAVNHLDVVMSQYPSGHPAVLEALLSLSKLTHAAGRIKDSYNLIKRASKDIEKIDPDQRLYKNFHEWLDFLNNT